MLRLGGQPVPFGVFMKDGTGAFGEGGLDPTRWGQDIDSSRREEGKAGAGERGF